MIFRIFERFLRHFNSQNEKTVISILFVAKSDENAFQSRKKHFSGHDFEIRAKREF